ncbi:unnamed protein product [Clonostachys solani]|uniref:Ribosomal RNA-processing protein 17 n=1 Tax=Clonostachys solani TaxID=160281 RepID=A0A9N9ZDT9_9HYPO|nr:unnamed protein product [Clonostachys solani]
MFAKPRPKKLLLAHPSKKRKFTSAVEEVTFDNAARHEYLTGFHKRKQERIKRAQEEAVKRERLEKIETRKQVREERKKEVEDHVNMVNKLLRESGAAGAVENEDNSEDDEEDGWGGFPDRPNLDIVDHEEEYIDEDRYTTVTVESVSVSRDGLEKPVLDEPPKDDEPEEKVESKPETKQPAKKKKPKFRYETKFDRQLADRKHRAKKAKR